MMEDPISMIAVPTPDLVTEDSACGLSPEGPAAKAKLWYQGQF